MSGQQCSISVGHLRHPERPLFHILLEPRSGEPRGTVLFLHPFAEEMNLSRRNVAVQSRALAALGYRVLLPDLSGCGDGHGEFADADWDTWRADANFALDHLLADGSGDVFLWGLRLGGLLACQLAQERAEIRRLLLWQPVLNGEQHMDQFLRLRTASSALGSGAVFDRRFLWGELRAGRTLEVAGYELTPALALQIAAVRLRDLTPRCPVNWFEVGAVGAGLSRAGEGVLSDWRQRGVDIQTSYTGGEPFWRIHEAPVNADLLRVTAEALA